MYITDVWGVVYKIDVRSGTAGRIVWKMDPGQQKPDRNRGVALWGNLVISVTGLDGRVIATDKETGKIVWDKNLHDQPDLELTAAPLALKDSDHHRRLRRRQRRARLARRARSQDRRHEMEDIRGPGAGRARQRDLEGQEQRLADRRRRLLRHRLLRPGRPTSPIGEPAIRRRATIPPTVRATICSPTATVAFDAATGKMKWYFQYTPNDTTTTTPPARRSSSTARSTARIASSSSHRRPQWLQLHVRSPQRPVPQGGAIREKVNWTKGIDPEDRQARRLRSEQGRADLQPRLEGRHRQDHELLPGRARRHQFLAAVLQRQDAAPLYRRRRRLRRHHPRSDRPCARQVRRRRLRQRCAHHRQPHRRRSR